VRLFVATVVAFAAVAGAAHAACAPVPAYPFLRASPHYRLTATVTANGSVTGTEYVYFRAPRITNRIVLRLWANGPATRSAGARLTARVTEKPDGARAVRTSDPTLLALALALHARRRDSRLRLLASLALFSALQLPYALWRTDGKHVAYAALVPLATVPAAAPIPASPEG
jgi:hypothetical protein